MRSTALLIAGTSLSMLSVVACGTEPPEEEEAATLQIVSGDGQSGLQGSALPQPLVVRVFDQFGDPFAGAEVAWEAMQPNIVLSDDRSITDASGLAETSVTLAKQPGPVAVTARLVGVPGEQISFSLISQATSTITDTIPANSPDTLMLTVANGARLVIPPGSFINPTEVRLSEAPTGTSGLEAIAAVDVSIRQLGGPGAPSVAGGAVVPKKFFIAFEASFVPEAIDAVWIFASPVIDPVGFLAETIVDAAIPLIRAILNVVPSLQFRAEYIRYDEPSCDANYELRLLEGQSSRGVTVVLVHGWQPFKLTCKKYDSDVAEKKFSRIIDRNSGVWLDRPYHNLVTFTYPSYNSPESAARKLAAALESEPALRPIIMLGHSMGGLVSRRAAQLLSQSGVDIRGIVTLGTPHYGTELATGKLPFDKPTQMAACVGAQLATTPAAEKAERAGVALAILKLGLFAFLGTAGARSLAPHSPFLDSLNDTPISPHRIIGFGGDISQSHLGSSDLFFKVTAVGHCALKLEWGHERTDGIVPLVSALRSGMEATSGYDHFDLLSGVGAGADAVYFEQLRSAVLNVSPSWVDGRVTSADGTGYAGAVVRLLNPVDDLDLASVTTDADGNYAFDLVEPGSYLLLLENTGGLDSEPLTPYAVSLEAGQIERIDFLLSEQGTGTIIGEVRDAVTFGLIAGATITYGVVAGSPVAEVTTEASGQYTFTGVPAGTWVVEAIADGYVTNTAANLIIVDVEGDLVRADFALPPVGSTQRFGSLSGRVLTTAGNPISGASITLSGGTQTNGVFRSTTADDDGTYGMTAIVLDDVDGVPISSFTVAASAVGFATQERSVTLVENQTVTNVDFQLAPSTSGAVFFSDGFETESGWTTDGLWNRSTLVGIVNTAYPTYVNLAPDDNSGGVLPAPAEGQRAFWYGDPETGNFLGEQSSSDTPGSGGRSTGPNDGQLVSPAFFIPADAPAASLRYDTWFEIESVNPNSAGFDIMLVAVRDVGTGAVTELGRLNPFVDPPFPDRQATPFTSGGFNVAPVWRRAEADLTPFIGRTVQLIFEFDTRDELYNGFRGWIVDNVAVTDQPAGETTAGVLQLRAPAGPKAPPRESR